MTRHYDYEGYRLEITIDDKPLIYFDVSMLATMYPELGDINLGITYPLKDEEQEYLTQLVDRHHGAMGIVHKHGQYMHKRTREVLSVERVKEIATAWSQENVAEVRVVYAQHSERTGEVTLLSLDKVGPVCGYIYILSADLGNCSAEMHFTRVLRDRTYLATQNIYMYKVYDSNNNLLLESRGFIGDDHKVSGLYSEAELFVDNIINGRLHNSRT